ncbi:photosystem I chlorophyll a/b-binding protein 2, chloroplastic-like [Brassica napus]|uniref:photosystem I chlorophyll a/b-binding protein 2, chloroplastic-like n=1 Tax=Brassica napus TaxID=3708 RepID=UPI00207A4C53|nr:photosystem I chlorophyll a/b-binding protein 2, chloroplastic-like [Brassica napus]
MVDDIDLNRLGFQGPRSRWANKVEPVWFILVYFEFQLHHAVSLYKQAIKSYELHLQWFWFDPIFPNNKPTGTYVGYPGEFWFDPLDWGSDSPTKIKELRTKEIKNGRLAMLEVMGAWFQHIYTGTCPIDKLFAHLADPGHTTIFAAFTPK